MTQCASMPWLELRYTMCWTLTVTVASAEWSCKIFKMHPILLTWSILGRSNVFIDSSHPVNVKISRELQSIVDVVDYWRILVECELTVISDSSHTIWLQHLSKMYRKWIWGRNSDDYLCIFPGAFQVQNWCDGRTGKQKCPVFSITKRTVLRLCHPLETADDFVPVWASELLCTSMSTGHSVETGNLNCIFHNCNISCIFHYEIEIIVLKC